MSYSNSLVSSDWEVIDPTPDPVALFLQYNNRFFWGKLSSVIVKWSPRMTSCAGICCYEGRGGLCTISLSAPLLKLRPRKDLVETLLHEMIHAYLFVTMSNRDRDGHGPEFQKHMHRINSEANTSITIYHSFHEEVRHYKTHVWKCNGPCRDRKPYFGIVGRASNRAPGPNDLWWNDHQKSCGGKYQKISEPEEFTKKQQIKKDKQAAKAKKDEAKEKAKITNYFPNTPAGSNSSKNGPETKEIIKKKQVFKGVNVLGSLNTEKRVPDTGSTQPVRRIPGFGHIPVRIGGAAQSSQTPSTKLEFHTKVLQNSATTTMLEDTVYTSSTHSAATTMLDDTVYTSNTHSSLSSHKNKPGITSDSKTKLNGAVSQSSKGKDISSRKRPLHNKDRVHSTTAPSYTVVISDSDDDVPLLTKPKCENVKDKTTTQTVIPSGSDNSRMVTLSDSDDEKLDILLAQVKHKRKRLDKGVTSSSSGAAGTAEVRDSVQGETVTSGSCPICGAVLPLDVLPHHVDECCISDQPITVQTDRGGCATTGSTDPQYVPCPVCDQIVSASIINRHLDDMCASL